MKTESKRDKQDKNINLFQCHDLERSVKLKGQIVPLSTDEANQNKTKVALVTDDGRKFFINASSVWNISLWGHIWDYVNISGRLNLTNKTIYIKSLHPLNAELYDSDAYHESYDDFSDTSGLAIMVDSIRKGEYLQPVGA